MKPEPLFARLRIVPPGPPRTITSAGFYGPRGAFRVVPVTVSGGSYSAELDCGAGRVHRLPPGFSSEAAARQAAVTYAARVLGRAILFG